MPCGQQQHIRHSGAHSMIRIQEAQHAAGCLGACNQAAAGAGLLARRLLAHQWAKVRVLTHPPIQCGADASQSRQSAGSSCKSELCSTHAAAEAVPHSCAAGKQHDAGHQPKYAGIPGAADQGRMLQPACLPRERARPVPSTYAVCAASPTSVTMLLPHSPSGIWSGVR